ncbi:SprT-like domain-containing protein [Haladaptatus cibarius]|uniref:SprT-like domain-containing protein n=1 Tax=Haladaptatus cibarius TaxID=453847 RepID=UPI000679E79F|nr:SprT-like domain-containing protein [Haladaptatus cibarius]
MEPTTRDELLSGAESYAETVPIEVELSNIDWECSERAVRRAGVCIYDRQTEAITIRLTWSAYRAFGWEEFTGTIRHELVHAWEFQQFGESGHGTRFAEKAKELDAPRHCRTFSEARLRLRCSSCDWDARRYRASKAVKNPAKRRCGDCGSRYRVEHSESGRCWRTHAGYLVARRKLGDEW